MYVFFNCYYMDNQRTSFSQNRTLWIKIEKFMFYKFYHVEYQKNFHSQIIIFTKLCFLENFRLTILEQLKINEVCKNCWDSFHYRLFTLHYYSLNSSYLNINLQTKLRYRDLVAFSLVDYYVMYSKGGDVHRG